MPISSFANSPPFPEVPDRAAARPSWTPLRYFNNYRLILAGLLVVLAFSGVAPRSLGPVDASLFEATAISYLGLSVVSSFAIRWRFPAFDVQVFLQVVTDIIIITLLMHASGGVTSGFGMLLVVAIAGGSILTYGRIAILFAAMASLAVLLDQIYTWFSGSLPTASYTHAGILGAAFFATALLAHTLARRIRASEALAAEREIDLANLAQLNEHIVQRMQSGILVIDSDDQVRLSNESASNLLGVGALTQGGKLSVQVPRLHHLRREWGDDGFGSSKAFRPEGSQVDVLASFAGMGPGARDGVIIFLQDASAMTQRAQQLKLASLGRLTASIAHEIRNPLGAISHAEQLLAESEALTAADRRLTRIIRDNCARMNFIVEDVLQLSRHNPAVQERVALAPWLRAFAAEMGHGGLGRGKLDSIVEPDDLQVRFDPGQLHQVVSNLTENGLRHASEGATVELRAGVQPETQRPYLDVTDDGGGVASADVEHIFEPFYTTRPDGTGLGLYIARELCEVNQASLNYMPSESGSRFRVTFADPRRHAVPPP